MMRLESTAAAPWDVTADVLAVPIYRDDAVEGELAELDRRLEGAIAATLAFGELAASDSKTTLIATPSLPSAHLMLVDAGRRGGRVRDSRRATAIAVRRLQGRSAPRLAFWLRDGTDADRIEAAGVGAFAGTYRPAELYGRVKDTDDSRRSVESVVFIGEVDAEALERASTIGEGVLYGRDLANRSANDLTPQRMAEYASELEADGCSVEVLGLAEMREQGMGALIGVGQGSDNEPRLIAIRLPGWDRASDDRRLAIIGKGVCFDSGGISIKPAEKMEEMKWDKSGAAAVIAAARTVARLNPDVPLMAVAPMVENMPGGRAQRPGDVVKTLSGKTVEVTNTDAEGRLILADAMTYAERAGATHLVDIATLTGAAQIALGEQVAAVFSRPDDWGRVVKEAGESTG